MRYPACRFDRGDGLQKTIRTRGQSFKPRVRLRQRHTAAARDGRCRSRTAQKAACSGGGPISRGQAGNFCRATPAGRPPASPAAFKERPRPQRLVRRPASGPGPDALRGPAGPEDWCRRPGRLTPQKLGSRYGPAGLQLGERAGKQRPPLAQHQHMVSNDAQAGQVMAHHHQGHAGHLLPQGEQKGVHARGGDGVQAAGGFVAEQHARLGNDGPGQTRALRMPPES